MRRQIVLPALGVLVAVAALYAGNVRNEFVRLDDFEYVVKNAHIHGGLTFGTVRWAFADAGYASNWHPLTWLSHAADVTIAEAFGWDWREEADEKGRRCAWVRGPLARLVHGENVVLHAVNAVLLYFVILALIRPSAARPSGVGDAVVAAGCALFWAVHPLRVEVVAWASERKELLSVCFMLLTMIAYIRGIVVVVEKSCTKEVSNSIVQLPLFSTTSFCYAFSLFTFTFSLLAKPVAVSLPAVLFGVEMLRSGGARLTRRQWGRLALRLAPFVLLSVGACVMTMSAQTQALEQGGEFSVLTRVVCAVEAPVVYLRQTLWPFGLSVSYPMPETWRSVTFALGLALVAGLAALGTWWVVATVRGRCGRVVAAVPLALAWCYVALVPMLGVVKVGYQPHSDRYTYWVGCGLAAVVALAAAGTVRLWRPYARRVAVAALCLLSVWGLCTLYRSSRWRTSLPLFTDAVASALLESDAWVLSELMYQEWKAEGGRKAVEMLRDVLAVRRSAYARAILAHALAISGEAAPRANLATGAEESFQEARFLAEASFDGEARHGRPEAALAALGLIEYRLRNYAKAYDYMKRAYDAGYECHVLDLKLEDFRKKAEEGGVK